MWAARYENLDKLNKELNECAAPIMDYINKFKVPVKSVFVSPEMYDKLASLLQQKQWEEFLLFKDPDHVAHKYIIIYGPHGPVEIKRKVD